MSTRYIRRQPTGVVRMGHVPPYIRGGAVLEPYFGWSAFVSGASQLPQTLNLNGVDVTASTFYVGDDSTGATWPSRGAGSTLGLTGAGAAPTPGQISSFSDGTRSVRYTTGVTTSNQAPDLTTGDLGSENAVIVMHYYHAASGVGARLAARKAGLAAGQAGWAVNWATASTAQFYLSDGVTQASFSTTVSFGWNTFCLIVNSATSVTWGARNYINGVFSNSRARPVGSLDSGPALTVGGDATTVYQDRIALLAIYKGLFLPDDASASAIMDAIALEIAQRLDGSWPQYATGSRLRTTSPRGGVAYALVTDGTDVVAEQVGNNLMRVCRGVRTGQAVGMFFERGVANQIIQSQDLAQVVWTKLNSSIFGSASGPDRNLSMQTVSSDASNAEHGVTQNVNISSATQWTYSFFVRARAKTWAYADVSTEAGVSAYFDLTNAVVGTTGVGVLDAGVERWTPTLLRCWITWTSTVAVHTFRALAATGDGGAIYAGPVAEELDLGWFQVESNVAMTSPIRTTTAVTSRLTENLRYDATLNWPLGARTNRAAFAATFFNPRVTSRFVTTVATAASAEYEAFLAAFNVAYDTNYTANAGGVTQMNISAPGNTADGAEHVLRATLDVNDGKFYVDGVLAGSDATVVLPNMTGGTIYLGQYTAALSKLAGVLTSFLAYDQAVAPGEQGTGNDT